MGTGHFRELLAACALAVAACSGGPATSAACNGAGGACVATEGCGADAGHVSTAECPGFPANACCLALSACAAPEPVCCDGSAAFRPNCTGGEYVCASGTFCVDGG